MTENYISKHYPYFSIVRDKYICCLCQWRCTSHINYNTIQQHILANYELHKIILYVKSFKIDYTIEYNIYHNSSTIKINNTKFEISIYNSDMYLTKYVHRKQYINITENERICIFPLRKCYSIESFCETNLDDLFSRHNCLEYC